MDVLIRLPGRVGLAELRNFARATLSDGCEGQCGEVVGRRAWAHMRAWYLTVALRVYMSGYGVYDCSDHEAHLLFPTMAFPARVAARTVLSGSLQSEIGCYMRIFTSLACAVSYCRFGSPHPPSAASCAWSRAKWECRASPLRLTMRSRPLAFGLGPVGESFSTHIIPAPPARATKPLS